MFDCIVAGQDADHVGWKEPTLSIWTWPMSEDCFS
jgi:hypothetical protein